MVHIRKSNAAVRDTMRQHAMLVAKLRTRVTIVLQQLLLPDHERDGDYDEW